MTGMEHAIEHAARILIEHPSIPTYGDGSRDVCPSCPDADVAGPNSPSHAAHQARALAEAGLLAPAPLTEEWHAAYYGVTPDGVRHLRLIGTEGSWEHAEEARADCAQDDPDTEFFLVRRPVHDWLPVSSDDGTDQ